MKNIKKISGIFLLGLTLIQCILVDKFIVLNGLFADGDLSLFDSLPPYILSFILRFLNGGVIITCLLDCFHDHLFLKKMNAYLIPIITIFNLIFFNTLLFSYIGEESSIFRIVLLLLTILIPLIISVLDLVHLYKNKELNLKECKKMYLF